MLMMRLLWSSTSSRRCFSFSRNVSQQQVDDASSSSQPSTSDSLDKTKSAYKDPPKRLKGKVRKYNLATGFGFIDCEDSGESVFVHHREIFGSNPAHGFSSLRVGEVVEFDLANGPKGPKAAKVTGPSGAPVQGSFLANKFVTPPAPPKLLDLLGKDANIFSGGGQPRPKLDRNFVGFDVQGTVEFYDVFKGFGRIRCTKNGEAALVRVRNIAAPNPFHPLRTLRVGERVQFHAAQEHDGKFYALNVTGPGGAPVLGALQLDLEGPIVSVGGEHFTENEKEYWEAKRERDRQKRVEEFYAQPYMDTWIDYETYFKDASSSSQKIDNCSTESIFDKVARQVDELRKQPDPNCPAKGAKEFSDAYFEAVMRLCKDSATAKSCFHHAPAAMEDSLEEQQDCQLSALDSVIEGGH